MQRAAALALLCAALDAGSLGDSANALKEKAFRTRARLLLLQQTAFGADPRAVLFHRNEMGSSFQLVSAAYSLDGVSIFEKTGEVAEEVEIWNGRLAPGPHKIEVLLAYRGHGFGIFSYIEGYRFKLQSSYTFNAEAGKATVVKITGYEKGNALTTDLREKPAVRYDVEVRKELRP